LGQRLFALDSGEIPIMDTRKIILGKDSNVVAGNTVAK
jgi:hypothetical protein